MVSWIAAKVSAGRVLRPLLLAIPVLGGCGWRSAVQAQSEHLVAGTLVTSEPEHPLAYLAYLQARLALEAQPPEVDVARARIHTALQIDGDDPHLWTTLAEIEASRGDAAAASSSLARALTLAPDYPPARALAARLGRGAASGELPTAGTPAPNPG